MTELRSPAPAPREADALAPRERNDDEPSRGGDRSSSAWSWFVGLALVAAVLSPTVRPGVADSFPFSSYPMFSRRLDEPRLDRFVGRTQGGELVLLAPRLLGTREPLQAATLARRAAAVPTSERRAACVDVARRVAADPTLGHVVTVELLRERWRLDAFDGRSVPEPSSRTRRVGCEVQR